MPCSTSIKATGKEQESSLGPSPTPRFHPSISTTLVPHLSAHCRKLVFSRKFQTLGSRGLTYIYIKLYNLCT